MIQKLITEKFVELVIAVILASILVLGIRHYQHLQMAAAQNENRAQVLTNASAGVADGVDIDAQQQAYAQGLADASATFKTQTNEDRRNEPQTAVRDAAAVPASRLRAFRERRLARERLGCAGCEREERQ